MSTYRVQADDDYYNYTQNETVNRTKRNGQYNVIEKDFGDHKRFYYVPEEYGNDYDISQLDEIPINEEQHKYYSPRSVRRKYDYIDELPIISPRRYTQVSPRRAQVTSRTYYEPPPQKVKYVHEDDNRPEDGEIIEYIVRDRRSRQRYIEEPESVHRSVYIKNSPSPQSFHNYVDSHRASPSSPRLTELSTPRRSILKQQTPRRTINQSPNRILVRNHNEQNHISLKDVLAQNRAKRGTRIPKPRREVDEENFHDLPIYNRNIIKNGFIVHK